jgi:terminase small subunit-like protein
MPLITAPLPPFHPNSAALTVIGGLGPGRGEATENHSTPPGVSCAPDSAAERSELGKPDTRLDAAMAGRATVFRWIACHKEFRDEYTLVRELRAEDLAEEMIADDPCVWVEKIRADGRAVMVLDHENIARVHLRIKALKRQAAQMARRKYGNRR